MAHLIALQAKAGFRASDTVPENISRSICEFSGDGGQPMLGQFLAAIDDVCSAYVSRSQVKAAQQITALQKSIKEDGYVLQSCYAQLLTGSTDTQVCEVMAQALRACMTSTDRLVDLIINV